GSFFLFGSNAALADDCAALGGNIVGTECVIDGSAPGTPPNTRHGNFVLAETLHFKAPGVITVDHSVPNSLKITITGDLIMDAGTTIDGDAAGASGVGADIEIDASGNLSLAGGSPGAAITSDQIVPTNGGSCAGGHSGNITLKSTGGGNITTGTGS